MSVIKEAIFSHAVALQQTGRMKNAIYASGKTVFIMNLDKTILLKFGLPDREPKIDGKISFLANDYDSDDFYEEDGKIIFVTKEGAYKKTKSCVAPEKDYDHMGDIWRGYIADGMKVKNNQSVTYSKSIIGLLDEGLSHIEISSEDKSPVLIQRDIYTGSIIKITSEDVGGLGLGNIHEIKKDFAPIGIRTNDFIALFSFCNTVTFVFADDLEYTVIKGDKLNLQGILANCKYDEMIETTTAKKGSDDDGRKVKKIGKDKQETDTKASKRKKQVSDQTEELKPKRKRTRKAKK